MIKPLVATKSRRLFLFTLLLLLATDLATLFNVPITRQVFAFVLLTFIPGGLILLILRLNRLGLVEKIVLSVGLSIAFSMLFGLVLNALSLAIGYAKPLSTVSLLISFNLAIIVLAVFAYIRNREITFSLSGLKLTTREKIILILPSLFPLLSVVGMRLMNLADNNVLLMLLLFAIPAFVIFVAYYRDKIPQRLYPGLIFLISISLLLMLALRSNHIIGADIHEAYYYFQTTLDNLHWRIATPSLVNALLSISLLPSIYQLFMNVGQEYLYKVLYALLFSFSPLVVYVIARKYIGDFYAFIATFFFMSQFRFLWAATGPATTTAVLFFALAIMVLFGNGMTIFARRFLFITFAASCILSHYTTSYIFLFMLLLTWTGMKIVPWILAIERKLATAKHTIRGGASLNSPPTGFMPEGDGKASEAPQIAAPDIPQTQPTKSITINIVALFFVMLFFWYSQITVAPFSVGLSLIYKTFANLGQWFVLEAKGSTISTALGEDIYTIPQTIRVVFSWLSVAFIAIGVLSTLARYRGMIAIPGSRHAKLNFLNSKFELEYFMLSLACCIILVGTFVLPFISLGYSMERVYFQALVILSPFFIVGGIAIARWLRARPAWVILVVMIPFFMGTTGTMYQIFGTPASIAINSAGVQYEKMYIHDAETKAAKWLTEHTQRGATIYTEHELGARFFMSQGGIPRSRLRGSAIPHYEEGGTVKGYIHLRSTDITVDSIVTKYPDIFAEKNKIYSAGHSEIYL